MPQPNVDLHNVAAHESLHVIRLILKCIFNWITSWYFVSGFVCFFEYVLDKCRKDKYYQREHENCGGDDPAQIPRIRRVGEEGCC